MHKTLINVETVTINYNISNWQPNYITQNFHEVLIFEGYIESIMKYEKVN